MDSEKTETSPPKGYLAFVLHAHLPYVRHPEYDAFLEERWLYEAISETYIPFIKFAEQLIRDKVPFQLTLSISPSLLAMLEDPLLQNRYRKHLSRLIMLAEKENERAEDPHIKWLSEMYRGLFFEAQRTFEQYQGRLSRAFAYLHEKGVVELITTSATHGILPLLAAQPKAAQAQVAVGLDYFESVFGFKPKGMWIPECAYTPGVDQILREMGIRYFCVESQAIEHASHHPFYGVNTPVFTPNGVAAFGRDDTSTKEVWSADVGFPGDGDYREFYRDIGHDADFPYIQSMLGGDVPSDTGIKYHKITGRNAEKELYNPDIARDKAALHAGQFVAQRVAHIEQLAQHMDVPPIVCAPFDAELFGHWWFEGPQWLNFVIRKSVFDQETFELTGLSQYLDKHPVHQVADPATSTWGHAATCETWLNEKTDWIYDRLVECTYQLQTLAQKHRKKRTRKIIVRALNQCLRELLLAQSSDWPFIISNGTATQYAERRVNDHLSRFQYLSDAVENDTIDEEKLAAIEYMDAIFPDASYRLFCD